MSLFKEVISSAAFILKRAFKREFKGSVIDRTTQDWKGSGVDINRAVKMNWSSLLSRSREQSKNNSYFKGWLGHCRANIPGPNGFSLQSKVTDRNNDLDEKINNAIEKAFDDFSEKENCTVHGDTSLLQLQWLLIDTLKRDGEILLRKVFSNKFKHGFAFETFEVEDLDHNLNEELSNGNVIVMGVEYNEWKRPVRYYIKKRNLLSGMSGYPALSSEHSIYPADEIIHGFDKTHPRQARGIPEAAAVLIEMRNIDRWEDASLKNAIYSARNLGFISRKYGDISSSITGPGNEKTTPAGGTAFEFKENTFTFLDDGEEFVGFDPKFPLEQHDSFVKSVGRKIASGIRMGFNKLFNNYESVNFSSLRSSELTEQRNWTLDQNLFVEIFFKNFYKDWLMMSILAGQIPGLNVAKIAEYNKPFWQGTRWDWVDPLKDISAVKLALEENLTTLTDELSKKGKDFTDVISRRTAEIKKLIELEKLKQELNVITGKSSVEVDYDKEEDGRTVFKITGRGKNA